MYFVLMDSSGNLIESYDDEDTARAALDQIADAEPDSADEVAVVVYDDLGNPTDQIAAATSHPVSA